MAFEVINKIFCRCELPYLIKHCLKNYLCPELKIFTSYSLTCPSFGSLGQPSLFVFLALFTCQCPLIILIFVFQKYSKVFNFSSQESHPIPKTNKPHICPFWNKKAENLWRASVIFCYIFPFHPGSQGYVCKQDKEYLILNTYITHLHNLHLLIVILFLFLNILIIKTCNYLPVYPLTYRFKYGD